MPKPIRKVETKFKPVKRPERKSDFVPTKDADYHELIDMTIDSFQSRVPSKIIGNYLLERVHLGEMTREELYELLNHFKELKKLSKNYLSNSIDRIMQFMASNTNLNFTQFKKILYLTKKYYHLINDDRINYVLNKLIKETNVLDNDYLFARFDQILSGPLVLERLEEFYDSIIARKRETHGRIYDGEGRPTNYIRRATKSVIRSMNPEQYQIWKTLYEAGFPIEKIEKEYSGNEAKEIAKQFNEAMPWDVYSKSKIEGVSLHEILLSGNNISKEQAISIFRQVLNITKKLWNLGILHGHPHFGNWIIRFEYGQPKVILIDFKKVKHFDNLTQAQKHHEYDYYFYDVLFELAKRIDENNPKKFTSFAKRYLGA